MARVEGTAQGEQVLPENSGAGIFFIPVKADSVQGDFLMVAVETLHTVTDGLKPLASGAVAVDDFPEPGVVGILIQKFHLNGEDPFGALKPDKGRLVMVAR